MNRRLFLRNLSGLGILAAIPSAFRSVFMADYPGTLPTFAANGANLSTAPHSALHTDLNQELVAVATALGTNPQGTLSTVKARLDKIAPYTGALTAWTPTCTQGVTPVTVTTGGGTRYMRVGRMITGWFDLTVTSTGTASQPIFVSTPVACFATVPCGGAYLSDASSGNIHAAVLLVGSGGSPTTFDMRGAGAGGDNRVGTATTIFTAALASGDILKGSFTYEAAAD